MIDQKTVLELATKSGFNKNPFYPSILTAKGMSPVDLMDAVQSLVELSMQLGSEQRDEYLIKRLEASIPPDNFIWEVVDKIREFKGQS
jgi:hypothetical protein